MQLLRSKLIEPEERKRAEEWPKVRGEVKDVAWARRSAVTSCTLTSGSGIDRTGHESGDTQGVLDGDIDAFVGTS